LKKNVLLSKEWHIKQDIKVRKELKRIYPRKLYNIHISFDSTKEYIKNLSSFGIH